MTIFRLICLTVDVVILQANGGNGYNSGHRGGGGGSGGRIALYYEDQDYDGLVEAYGGSGNDEYGAAGTIYHHQVFTNKTARRRSLYVNNKGHSPQTKRVNEVMFDGMSFTRLWKHDFSFPQNILIESTHSGNITTHHFYCCCDKDSVVTAVITTTAWC